jgi:putative membrane protein
MQKKNTSMKNLTRLHSASGLTRLHSASGLIFLIASPFLFLIMSCNNAPDSVKDAKDSNAGRVDSQKAAERPVDSLAVPPKADADFLVNAASGGMLEVQLGQLAQTNGSDPGVKAFGARMVKDHGEGGEKLKTLAGAKHVTIPAAISNEQQKEFDDLQKKNGRDFDKAYIKLMVTDHKDDIKEFEQEGQKGVDPEIRTFANSNLAMLQMHLDAAMSLEKTKK